MFDRLVLALGLWDESKHELVAEGVNLLVDEGTTNPAVDRSNVPLHWGCTQR
jgi:hypothetical protein